MTRKLICALLPVLYLLHNDLWLWNDATLIAGLPVGLVYHIGFCFAASLTLYLLVTRAWPTHLEVLDADTPETEPS
jgi:hypothetical protein